MPKTIVIITTLDTKKDETMYLKERIKENGHDSFIIDVCMRKGVNSAADFNNEEVLQAAGKDPESVFFKMQRAEITELMIKGARNKVKEMHLAGKLDGIIGIGGATGTLMSSSIMKVLPFGMPKFIVSGIVAAKGLASRYFGTSDITIMHSVVDFTGLNDFTRDLLDRAAGAISGMASAYNGGLNKKADSKVIAMTELGIGENCASYIRRNFEKEGYQIVGFSAAGVADKAMEEMIEQQPDIFCAVIDLAPGGVGEQLLGGTRAAGPNRMEAAGKAGIPQLIAPCAVNLMSPLKSKYKPDYNTRKKYAIDSLRTFLRLSQDEMKTVAGAMAEKLNKAKGPVKFLIPMEGWSEIDNKTSPIYEPETDRVFVEELKKCLNIDVEVREIEANLDEQKFAEEVIKAVKEML